MQKLLQNSFAIFLCILAHKAYPLSLDQQIEMREKQIRELATDYESIMIYQYYKSAFDSIPVDPLSGGGDAEKIYRDMLLQEYGKIIAKNAKLGVADSLYKAASKNDSLLIELRGKKNAGQ
ncbi:MAG: rod-binding protein [Alphaproteobacteria bacterium]|jgi:Rod binding domain-containing protein|nr:rod-binding protein [Candidatus Jidaibacter sp.]